MKKLILPAIVFTFAVLALMAFNLPSMNSHPGNPPQDKPVSGIPDDVMNMFETSCIDCHSDASTNKKAKLKLNFSKWGDLSDAKKVGKMDAINEILTKGDMPPEKYLEKYPDRALNSDQKNMIDRWVTAESKKLMGE